MGSPSKPNPPPPERADFEDQTLSTSNEATPVPWLVGTRKLAARWISRVYNQKAKEAPEARVGKK